jgi:hypothetical protein
MTRNAEFLADAAKSRLDITPVTGDAVRRVIAQMATTPKQLIERYNAITGT